MQLSARNTSKQLQDADLLKRKLMRWVEGSPPGRIGRPFGRVRPADTVGRARPVEPFGRGILPGVQQKSSYRCFFVMHFLPTYLLISVTVIFLRSYRQSAQKIQDMRFRQNQINKGLHSHVLVYY